MDSNLPNPQMTSQVIPPLPQMPPAKSNTGRNLLVAISALLIIVILLGSGYTLFFGTTQKKSYTAKVYNQPAVTANPTAFPTPSVYQVNVKDASDNAINSDTQATNQSLNSLDTDLNNVDQSFNDQQTNLQ